MESLSFDAMVIGTGQAGPPLATRLAESGMKTAIVEKSEFGGTCVNTGCTPTKALVACARVAHLINRSEDFGIGIEGTVHVNMKKVKARKDKLVTKSKQGVESWLRSTDNLSVIEGHAKFSGPNTITVNNQHFTAPLIFINAGGRPYIPSGFDGVHYLTSESILDLDIVPEHLIIVGGSYIGLEFAQMYRRFGSQVTIIEMADRPLTREDPDVSESIQEILEAEGINFRLKATCLSGKPVKNGVMVDIDCDAGDKQITGSHILLATGRRPNSDQLGLDTAGIETDDQGYIKVDQKLQTNVHGIYALGDINGKGAFTHTAYNDYEIVAENLLNDANRLVTDRIPVYALFIDPALARIGINETQARESGKEILMATRPMNRIARAREKGETKGFMKILVDAETRQIAGASILGIEGDEVIHSLLDMMYAKQPYTVIRNAVHIHPTVSELIPTALKDLKPL